MVNTALKSAISLRYAEINKGVEKKTKIDDRITTSVNAVSRADKNLE